MSEEQNGYQPEPFNPNRHLMQLKSGRGNATDYLPVNWRLVWLHSEKPVKMFVEVVSRIIELDREISKEVSVWNNDLRRSEKVAKTAKGFACYTMRASATFADGREVSAEMDGSESAVDFDDFVEKAQTKALGRALGAIGYGTQFAGDEFDEQHRIVDAPVARTVSPPESRKEQEGGIAKMCNDLKREVPDLSKVADGDVAKKWMDLYPDWKQFKLQQNQKNKSA